MRGRCWVLGSLMVVAVGCNEGNSEQPADASAKAHTPSFPEGEPLTWEQWKRQEQPARNRSFEDVIPVVSRTA